MGSMGSLMLLSVALGSLKEVAASCTKSGDGTCNIEGVQEGRAMLQKTSVMENITEAGHKKVMLEGAELQKTSAIENITQEDVAAPDVKPDGKAWADLGVKNTLNLTATEFRYDAVIPVPSVPQVSHGADFTAWPEYILDFQIKVKETAPDSWTSVFQIAAEEFDEARSPAVLIMPESRRLYVRAARDGNPNDGVKTRDLPLNEWTKVRIRISHGKLRVWLDGHHRQTNKKYHLKKLLPPRKARFWACGKEEKACADFVELKEIVYKPLCVHCKRIVRYRRRGSHLRGPSALRGVDLRAVT